jgi:hypothetical protein
MGGEPAIPPASNWDDIEDQLQVDFGERFSVREHYTQVATLWERSETYRDAVDALLAGDGSDEHRTQAAAAGEKLRDAIRDGSGAVIKLYDAYEGIQRGLQEQQRNLSTADQRDYQTKIDTAERFYVWIIEDNYVPAIKAATYREDGLYTGDTLLERAWHAEADRVGQNRIDEALSLIERDERRLSRDATRWASQRLGALQSLQ